MSERGQGRVFRPPGAKVWMLAYCGPLPGGGWGERRESSRTHNKREALAKLAERIVAVDRHRAGFSDFDDPKRLRTVTCGELFTHLLEFYKTSRPIKGLSAVHYRLREGSPLWQHLGNLPVSRLSTKVVDEFRRERQKETGPKGLPIAEATINRDVELLRRAVNVAVDRGLIPSLRRIKFERFTERNVRRRFITKEEADALIAQLPEPLPDMVRFSFVTGWRRGELLGLRWEWVDLQEGEIRLPDSKNGRPRTLPLSAELREIVERRWKTRRYVTVAGNEGLAEHLFHRRGRPINKNTFKKQWAKAREDAKVGDVWFHDLRRSGARNLIRAGVSLHVAMSITGHVTPSMYRRYDITTTEEQLAALESVSTNSEKSNLIAHPTRTSVGQVAKSS